MHPRWGSLLRWMLSRSAAWPLRRVCETAHLMTRVLVVAVSIAALSRFWHVSSLGAGARSHALEPVSTPTWRDIDSEPSIRYVTWVERVIASVSPWHIVAVSMVAGSVLRLWRLDAVGYNSDEAVYAGQAASWVNDPEISHYFPLVRAHPMLVQFVLAISFQFGVNDLTGRVVSVLFGLGTVLLVYLLGKTLYNAWTGSIAALFLTLMPYHVIVTRQVLLDGPLTFFATLTLLLLAKFARTRSPQWLWAVGAGMGLTFYAKETGIILTASIYAFLALCPKIRVRLRDLVISTSILAAILFSYPLSLALAGGGASEKARGYLVWQLLRRPNHEWTFYPTTVPPALGLLLLATAVAGLWWLRRQHSWRETLLLTWIAVPVVFFQLWPVKGFQYLLPVAPSVAVLAAWTLNRWSAHDWIAWSSFRKLLPAVGVGVLALSLMLPSWNLVGFVPSDQLLAGSGGVPGGRETGYWIDENVPEGAVFLCVGPSMANVVQFYGHRQAYGLSVSPNPLTRNPSYEPIMNPDRALRHGEVQYLVYDVYSASRSSHFGDRILAFAERYNGHVVHTEYVEIVNSDGRVEQRPVIIVFEVRP